MVYLGPYCTFAPNGPTHFHSPFPFLERCTEEPSPSSPQFYVPFTFYVAFPIPPLAWCALSICPACLGKTRRTPSRHCRDARVYIHTSTQLPAMHYNECTSPPPLVCLRCLTLTAPAAVRMNALLASGEVPGLYEGKELTALMAGCREAAQKDGVLVDSEDELFRRFTTKVLVLRVYLVQWVPGFKRVLAAEIVRNLRAVKMTCMSKPIRKPLFCPLQIRASCSSERLFRLAAGRYYSRVPTRAAPSIRIP